MTYILICLAFYTVLFFADIIPSVRQKQWKALKITMTILLVTIAVNILYGLDVAVPNPNAFLMKAIQSILHMK